MKQHFLIILLFSTLSSIGQIDSSIASFIKSAERNIELPNNLANDSCYYSNTLLKISIDERCNVSSILLSDNAEDWLVNELKRILNEKKLNVGTIEEYAKRKKLKSISLFMPVVIRSEWGVCRSRSIYWFNSRYYQFSGKFLNGNSLFLEPLEWILYEPVY
ncbi:MAG: hypothetical protein JNL23_10325 [Chitinophagaceae bacterium]|nr:hypothetical protein [Chitinophagaceae bacterium]